MFNLSAMINYAKTLINDFISTVYPSNCLNCSEILVKNEEYLCTGCLLGLPRTDYHKDGDKPLDILFVHNQFIEEAFCFLHFSQGGVAQRLLHQLKYKNRPGVGVFVGGIYAQDLLNIDLAYDLILPVPIHWKKIKKRGYNQSDYIADGMSQVLDLPVFKDCLLKSIPYKFRKSYELNSLANKPVPQPTSNILSSLFKYEVSV